MMFEIRGYVTIKPLILFKYRGFSSNTDFWAYRKTVLEENRVTGELFKYYLLLKWDYRGFQSPLFAHFFWPRRLSNSNKYIK